MAEEYKVLSQDDRDDMIVHFYHSQESDLFLHRINLERYDKMLKGSLEDKFRERITELVRQEKAALANVVAIMKATEGQLPTQERITASMLRYKERKNIRQST